MIHIITVYDSLNYGSFFQACALQWELEKYDNVDFVNVHHQNTMYQTLCSCGAKIIKGKFASAKLEYNKYKVFTKEKKSFLLVDIKSLLKEDGGIYFFGSDEIWNINRKKIRKTKEFFGMGFPDCTRIAVAPSVNRSSVEEFQANNFIADELNKFYAISVRDYHTQDVVKQVTGKLCDLVADPTLLHAREIYHKYQIKINASQRYILLYTYGMMLKPEVIQLIREFAICKQLKLISIGRWFDFCDENIGAAPREFLSYVDCAEYVITDTFHGLMFSLIYEKQFYIFPCGNVKVEEMLDILDLRERLYQDGDDFQHSIEKNIEYDIVTPRVRAHGEKTRKFLNKVMKKMVLLERCKNDFKEI